MSTVTYRAYKIEKGVPIPKLHKGSRPYKYPFGVMEVGDSFAFTPEEEAKVRAAAGNQTRSHGTRYTVSVSHLRCWRIA